MVFKVVSIPQLFLPRGAINGIAKWDSSGLLDWRQVGVSAGPGWRQLDGKKFERQHFVLFQKFASCCQRFVETIVRKGSQ